MLRIPPLIRLLQYLPFHIPVRYRDLLYRYFALALTFFIYTTYHLSRKPISIVKGELHRNCTQAALNIFYGSHSGSVLLEHAPNIENSLIRHNNSSTWCDWAPFDGDNYKSLYGALDYAFLFTYALAMFVSGYIGERIPLRYFLGFGMIFSGIFTTLFGMGYFWNVHQLWFFVVMQVMTGLFQTTGWPGVVAVVGKWFGKGRRGFIMGVWNSHTSVGNILGSVIASAFVQDKWGWSFVVPGLIIGGMGILCLLLLVEHPDDVGCTPPDQRNNNNRVINHPSSSMTEQDITEKEQLLQPSHDNDSGVYVGDNCEPDRIRRLAPEGKAISIRAAVLIPGVIEYSLCLLFAKLVSYTFLFWLPYYIEHSSNLSVEDSGLMSTLFDVGGIVGGIAAGLISDALGAHAVTCGGMLIVGAFMMYIYETFGAVSHAINVLLLLITGCFVNGPYSLITTAVSADLGTHRALEGNAKALATVTAIIDGTGSIGAAIGPLLTGVISPTGWNNVFYMLIGSNIAAFLLLARLMKKEISDMLLHSSSRSSVNTNNNECSRHT